MTSNWAGRLEERKRARRGIEKRYIFAPLELDATYPGCYASYEVNC
jgi:hypothetical protein